jgi:hypothetical protein
MVGLLCPCHESDLEYNARVAVRALEAGVSIQWYRTTTSSLHSWQTVNSTIVLDAVLSIVEDPLGPCLNIVVRRDANSLQLDKTFHRDDKERFVVQATTPRKTVWRVPFSHIHGMELVETLYRAEIQISSGDTVIMKFAPSPPSRDGWFFGSCCGKRTHITASTVLEYLRAIQIWNTERLEEIQEALERRNRAQRLRDERLRLLREQNDEAAAAAAARMAIV